MGKSTLPHHPLIGVWGGVRQGEAGVAERDSFDLDLEGLCLGPTDPSEFGFRILKAQSLNTVYKRRWTSFSHGRAASGTETSE